MLYKHSSLHDFCSLDVSLPPKLGKKLYKDNTHTKFVYNCGKANRANWMSLLSAHMGSSRWLTSL